MGVTSDRIHPSDYFDNIYCLSLERRSSRWQLLQQRLRELGIAAERILGIDGSLPHVEREFLSSGGACQLRNASEFGCLRSYQQLLEDAARNGYERILVLEDDVCFHVRFLEEFQEVKQLHNRWKLLYLGCSQYCWKGVHFLHDRFYEARDSLGSFAFAIEASLFQEFATLLAKHDQPVDVCLAELQQRHHGECFAFSPNVAIADVRESDIRGPRDLVAHAVCMDWDLSCYRLPLSPIGPIQNSDGEKSMHLQEKRLPDCNARRELDGNAGQFICGHPQVRASNSRVDANICQACDYALAGIRSDTEPATTVLETTDNRTGNSAVGANLPRSTDVFRRAVDSTRWNWALGVTTAPRRRSTLDRCLKSLQLAGWEKPHVFAEPSVQLAAEFANLPCTRRSTKLGAFPNWYVTLTELVMLLPNADAFAVVQDDIVCTTGLRDYLEKTLWPAPELGVVSAYCPSHYSRGEARGYFVENNGWDTWGALFYIFPNPSAKAILSDSLVTSHRWSGPAGGLRNIDSVVGNWCQQRSLAYFVHNPSLVQHIGDTSTIFQAANQGKRRASQFVKTIDDL